MKISLLSQNIWNKNFFWEKRKPLIIEMIQKLSPDIICLQEVVGETTNHTQVHELLKFLKNYDGKFFPVKIIKKKSYGLGLLLRKNCSLISTKEIRLTLPHKEKVDRFPRYIFYQKLKKNNDVIHLFHTHLSFGDVAGKRNYEELVKLLKALNLQPKTLLVGDFNETPTNNDINKLNSEKFDSSQFFDLGQLNGTSTWPINRKIIDDNWRLKNPDLKRPWDIHPKRMDRIYTLERPIQYHYKKVFQESKNIYHSDHYGVFVEIETK